VPEAVTSPERPTQRFKIVYRFYSPSVLVSPQLPTGAFFREKSLCHSTCRPLVVLLRYLLWTEQPTGILLRLSSLDSAHVSIKKQSPPQVHQPGVLRKTGSRGLNIHDLQKSVLTNATTGGLPLKSRITAIKRLLDLSGRSCGYNTTKLPLLRTSSNALNHWDL